MSRLQLKTVVALVAFVIASAGIAVAALSSFDDLAGAGFLPSGVPALLGPITEVGRAGWDCQPEKEATASKWHDADLPSSLP
jgi:hypothetical protein